MLSVARQRAQVLVGTVQRVRSIHTSTRLASSGWRPFWHSNSDDTLYERQGRRLGTTRAALAAPALAASPALDASGVQPVGEGTDTLGASEAAEVVGSTVSSLEPGVQYPLWFLDPEGSTYQAVMAMNDHTATALTWLHEQTHLPWWGTIVAATLCIRLAMLPLNIYAIRNTSRIADAAVEREKLRKAYQYAVSALGPTSPPVEKMRMLKVYIKGLNAALKKHHCYPWRSFVIPVMQIPMLIATMLGARHCVMLGDESFETGGMLWFTDLTVSDPTYALPLLAIGSSYLSLEILFYSPQKKTNMVTTASLLRSQGLLPTVKSAFQMFLVGALPFTVHLPSGLFLAWLCATYWSIGYVSMIRNPTAYQFLTGRRQVGRLPSLDDVAVVPAAAEAVAAAPVVEVVGDSDSDSDDGRGSNDGSGSAAADGDSGPASGGRQAASSSAGAAAASAGSGEIADRLGLSASGSFETPLSLEALLGEDPLPQDEDSMRIHRSARAMMAQPDWTRPLPIGYTPQRRLYDVGGFEPEYDSDPEAHDGHQLGSDGDHGHDDDHDDHDATSDSEDGELSFGTGPGSYMTEADLDDMRRRTIAAEVGVASAYGDLGVVCTSGRVEDVLDLPSGAQRPPVQQDLLPASVMTREQDALRVDIRPLLADLAEDRPVEGFNTPGSYAKDPTAHSRVAASRVGSGKVHIARLAGIGLKVLPAFGDSVESMLRVLSDPQPSHHAEGDSGSAESAPAAEPATAATPGVLSEATVLKIMQEIHLNSEQVLVTVAELQQTSEEKGQDLSQEQLLSMYYERAETIRSNVLQKYGNVSEEELNEALIKYKDNDGIRRLNEMLAQLASALSTPDLPDVPEDFTIDDFLAKLDIFVKAVEDNLVEAIEAAKKTGATQQALADEVTNRVMMNSKTVQDDAFKVMGMTAVLFQACLLQFHADSRVQAKFAQLNENNTRRLMEATGAK